MTLGKKKTALLWSVAAMFGGVASSFLALLVFFGGSDRDPAWVWALYIVFFYGGFVVATIGLICLIAFLAVPTKR